MTIKKEDYPSDSSLQRLREEVTGDSDKNKNDTNVPGKADGDDQDSVDKTNAGKPD